MSSTILEIGNAAAETVGLPSQSTLIGNSNKNAVRMLRSVRDASISAYRDFDWARLQKEHTFTTDGSDQYALPADFDRIINGTLWDRTNRRKVIGPIAPEEWQRWKSSVISTAGLTKLCRIVGNSTGNKEFKIYPETTTGYEIAFEYISSKFVLDDDGSTLKEEISKDGDKLLLDDEIMQLATIWRLLRILGLNYADEKIDYENHIAERAANDTGGQTFSMRVSSVYHPRDPNLPDTGYGA